MILIGMFDSPFVRRVAVSMKLLGMGFFYESVFRPADKRHEPWVQLCREQTEGARVELDRVCAALPKK